MKHPDISFVIWQMAFQISKQYALAFFGHDFFNTNQSISLTSLFWGFMICPLTQRAPVFDLQW